MFKRHGYPDRTTNVEARIGNTPLLWSSTGQIKVNEKCGTTSSNNPKMVEEFNCFPPLDGKYLSLQNMKAQYMNIAELTIFKSGRQSCDTTRNCASEPFVLQSSIQGKSSHLLCFQKILMRISFPVFVSKVLDVYNSISFFQETTSLPFPRHSGSLHPAVSMASIG